MEYDIIENLKIELRAQITQLKKHKEQHALKFSVFTIGNTRVTDNYNYYFTPFRKGDFFIACGVVLFSENEGRVVMELLDGEVDVVYVDCEKKSKNYSTDGFFNLERLSVDIMKKSKLRFLKGNDITADSLDILVGNLFKLNKRLIGGSNILIIGLGNLGFKISLKLVERGANVNVVTRSQNKAYDFVKTLNLIKPIETLSSVTLLERNNPDIDYSKLDIIILTHSSSDETYDELYNKLQNSTIVIDVGKGCLTESQVCVLSEKDVLMLRLDVGDTMIDFIEADLKSSDRVFKLPSFKYINKKKIITKGLIGKSGDIIVDSVENPDFIYGVCDGKGGLQLTMTEEEKYKILKLLNER